MIDPKTITKKKFITFMVIAFAVSMIPMIGAAVMLKNGNTLMFMFLFRVVAVFIPLIAVLISGSEFKKLGFKPKKFRYIPLALTGPQILTWIGMALFFMIFPGTFNIGIDGILSQIPDLNGVDLSVLSPSFMFIEIVIMSLTVIPVSQIIPSLGEEAGWRGVMYPYLKEHLGPLAGRILGGVLWGIWHWPLVIIGGYFYGSGHAVTGCLMICLALTSFGILIDHLYEKTGSILISSLAHSAMNAASMPALLLSSTDIDQILGPSAFSLIPIIPVIIVSVVIVIFSGKKKAR